VDPASKGDPAEDRAKPVHVYKFLDSQFGLKSLYERRLKIARVEELNDPFELTPYNLKDPVDRVAFQRTRRRLGERFGMVCFSATCTDPVLWAHYSDKHRGICLGFEIAGNHWREVEYVRDRLPFPDDFFKLNAVARLGVATDMIFTKYENWNYESEIRTWAPLDHEEDGLFFCDFDENLKLTQVLVGARCTLPKAAIARALGRFANGIELTKVRAAFQTFQIVTDLRGFK
jgi:hypothetical protein